MNAASMVLVTALVAGAFTAPAFADGPAGEASERSRRVMRSMIEMPVESGAIDSDALTTWRSIDELRRLQQPEALTLSPMLDRGLDRLFGSSRLLPAMDRSAQLGLAVFGAAAMLAAHAPRVLRPLFEGPVHFGPAFFQSGAMGAGLAGRF